MAYRIGIDVGGTKILGAGLIDGKIIKKEKVLISRNTVEDFSLNLLSVVNSLMANRKYPDVKIGIGFPGVVENDFIKKAPNLKHLEGYNFASYLKRMGFKDVIIDNDVRCFALGEAIRLNFKNLVGITVGTGIGGGIIIGGRIYKGLGNSGEFGHMVIEPNGRRCLCGNQGCLEEYVSKRALERETINIFGRPVDSIELDEMCKRGNRNAIQICRDLGFYLGIGLGNIANVLNTEVISLGGGLAQNPCLVRAATEQMRKVIYYKEPKLVLGRYESGAVGAANL
jgi:predicted NBD/HSP70 family sugar kinase